MTIGIRWRTMLEDNPFTVMDHVKGALGVAITQASLSTITRRIFEYASRENLLVDLNGSEIGTSVTLVIATSVFDTLQNNTLWTDNGGSAEAGHGYNFLDEIPPAKFPSPAKWYAIEHTFTPIAAGNAFKTKWGVSTSAVASS